MRHLIIFVISLFVMFAPGVCADTRFRNGDVFELRLSGPPEEFTREFNIVLTVDEGSVNLPLIGRIQAVGKTSTQLATEVETRLKQAKIFTIANVNITANVGGIPRFIIVGGSVRQPGRQQWVADLTLTGAISAAGGPGDFAGDGMKIVRGGVAERYSHKAIKRNPALDPKVQPNDIIEQEGD